MPRLSKIGAAALAAFGWSSGSAAVTASYLVVAGGGGGGARNGYSGAGGGAGGFRTGTLSLSPALSYTVTVGAGGSGGALLGNSGTSGGNSVFSTITSVGGGFGSGSGNGGTGGSGGGAYGNGSAGAGTAGQGNNGGGANGGGSNSASGGGAGAAGVNSSLDATPAAGGAGSASSISGSSVTYAGGGGGGSYTTASSGGAGGTGGGGNGGYLNVAGAAGTVNTGGGGGGGGGTLAGTAAGGSGGSGIVIISYAGAQQFGGGVVTSVGGNTIHTFTTSGVLSPITSLSASYLIVAGGGGGGSSAASVSSGNGGGAGGLLSGSGLTIDTNSTYLVTVGSGGAGGASGSNAGVSGSNSTFSMVSTAAVGGGFGTNNNGSVGGGGSGGNGGSGGGSSATAGTGTSGQGNAGGSNVFYGGGGGGASAVGGAGNATNGGAGGAGTASSISGTSTTYAGGGGGSGAAVGSGGAGGGGAGGYGVGVLATNAGVSGTANTGGGGGGSYGYSSYAGGNGGSGVVIISYAGATQLMAGGTVTISGGNVIHTFTSSGYLTPIKLVNRSLRFRSSASAYLNRTPASSGNQQKFTFSHWFKRGTLSTQQVMFGLNSASTNIFTIAFLSGDTFRVFGRNAGTDVLNLTTTAVFRDPAAWYHIVVAIDTTQSTSSNRAIVYINGVQVTAFGTSTYPSQNTSLAWNSSSYSHQIGREDTGNYVDGYLTEINFIDGQALTPNSFGTINSYGVWQPSTYIGSYGTNGFYLPFTNNASTTTLGYDFSPNGNNWTTNNISLTAGTTYDSMTDVPTLTSATAANYCVMNPLDLGGGQTTTNGNLTVNYTSGSWTYGRASFWVSENKFYWEITITATTNGGLAFGICNQLALKTGSGNNDANFWFYNALTGVLNSNTTNPTSVASSTTGDIVSFAFDVGGATLALYKNNSLLYTFTGITGSLFTAITGQSTSIGGNAAFNFGQRPFTYTPPSGFVALNTYNL